ncbi:uncharacterized protein LOC126843757 [Adelges cooleyi]|uniref:uncharacterized protein LOC126843757 n=1 Tax=Adelges cooleyi TaxID=133065 RepID=UPI0021807E5F|nr:uncharacterized protein LOC126843757 [Adelges cooleyi]
MISKDQTRKFIFEFILFLFCLDYTKGCDQQIYAEIGCKPVYGEKGSTSCPIAYDCEHVFGRSPDKCYFNGKVYQPNERLSETDSKLNPCLAACFCDQREYDNVTITKFVCANVECPSFFKHLEGPCYYQYDKDLCCEVRKFCPEKKTAVHECVHDGKTYKDGQRFYVGDTLQCVCSPQFNGTISDRFCRKLSCKAELLYMDNIMSKSAPVYFETSGGCPIQWFNPKYEDGTAEVLNATGSNKLKCKYGNTELALGQKLIFNQQDDGDTYDLSCSCQVPPLVTCIKKRKFSS